MKRILQLLASDCAFLYESCGMKIIDSEYLDEFGGNGSVVLADTVMQFRIWLDRNSLFLDIRKALGKHKWWSFDLVRQCITRKPDDDCKLNGKNIEFIRVQFDALRQLFADKQYDITKSLCEQYRHDRSLRLSD